MWFTTRQDGLDDNCHTNRGPCFQISGFFGTTLRIGFFLEFIALTFLFMSYWSNGGKGLFSYDLKNINDEYRLDQTFRNSITLWTEIFVIFCNSGCYSNLLLWLALGAVSLWSYYFEPEVNHVSPALHETELTNDVEQQVEKFSRYTPYPQDTNQNAYYPA
ncbi:hypothetical protein PFMG_02379 [Plasmodium falciparum IGH-CR14]|uniref:Uncharacterized protein n=1 Tax=Plasmodium falciparum IGH-CR14 TaxID=580059 RepID=A0A0L1I9F2_PLAFA|nr:hypothetical protein PFMG_02379 [Plasmodium falciparum IGH-CR14]